MKKKVWPYIIFIAVSLAVGGLSALLTQDGMERYAALEKPPLSPPGAVFPIVWSVLFILMGISAAMVYNSSRGDRNGALTVYAVQLVVNFFWSIIFFELELRLLAFFWILLLIILVVIMVVKFSKLSHTAAFLQIPYLIWLVFAAYLNIGAWMLNR